jgi:hypothetical protein
MASRVALSDRVNDPVDCLEPVIELCTGISGIERFCVLKPTKGDVDLAAQLLYAAR